jgi:hypothetical protein
MGNWTFRIHCRLWKKKRDKIASPGRFCRGLDFSNTKFRRRNSYTLDSTVRRSLVSLRSGIGSCNILGGSCNKICSSTHICE